MGGYQSKGWNLAGHDSNIQTLTDVDVFLPSMQGTI
jgi:hypothetical protein